MMRGRMTNFCTLPVTILNRNLAELNHRPSFRLAHPYGQSTLAARGASPPAFDKRCILAVCVALPSNTLSILTRHALSARRLARLGATPGFHHGLLALPKARSKTISRYRIAVIFYAYSSQGEQGVWIRVWSPLDRTHFPGLDKCRVIHRRLKRDHVAPPGKSLSNFRRRTHRPPSGGVPDKFARKIHCFDNKSVSFPATNRTTTQLIQTFVVIL